MSQLPSSPLLDDFCRPDESPLSFNGSWAKADTAFGGTGSVTNLSLTFTATPIQYYWTRATSFSTSEAWATVNGWGTGQKFALSVRGQQLGGSGQVDSYFGQVSETTGLAAIVRQDNAAGATTLASTSYAVSIGDTFVTQASGTWISLYVIPSGGLARLLVQAQDSNFATGGIGVYGAGTTLVVNNFGGGALDSLTGVPVPIRGSGATW